MARIPQRRLGHGVYHILNRAYDRHFIFDGDSDKAYLLMLLQEHREKYQLNIYHWVSRQQSRASDISTCWTPKESIVCV